MYSLLYADPPWQFKVYSRETGLAKAPDAHYETMTHEHLLQLKPEAAADSLLAMWVYDPMLPQALEVGKSWGFEFCTVLFRWLKTTKTGKLNFGLGYHTRGGGCEECWLFKRGKGLPVIRHDIRKEFYAPVREHSRKPDQVSGWLVDLYGDVPRLELFARMRTPGWSVMGNETERFSAPANT